jgi:hypothetical protein
MLAKDKILIEKVQRGGDSSSTFLKSQLAIVADPFQTLAIFLPTIDTMFDGPDFPESLDEAVFDRWLENGRQAKIGYHYLVIIWDEYESTYQPVYVARRDEIETFKTSASRERFIAAYDLYSESRIT